MKHRKLTITYRTPLGVDRETIETVVGADESVGRVAMSTLTLRDVIARNGNGMPAGRTSRTFDIADLVSIEVGS